MSSYDRRLLNETPKATRAQLQEGYNVNLLGQPPRRESSVRNPPSPQLSQSPPVPLRVTPAIPPTGSGEKPGSPVYTPAAPKPPTSFWRTRNGIITAVVIALVVIGVVVGGAVGGTISKTAHTSGTNPNNTSSESPSTFPAAQPTTTQTPEGVGPGGGVTGGAASSSSIRFTLASVSPTTTATSGGGQNSGGGKLEIQGIANL